MPSHHHAMEYGYEEEEEDSIGPMEPGILRPSQRITVFKRPDRQSLFPFLFGVEIELVLIPHEECSSWDEAVNRLSSALTALNVTNRIHHSDSAPTKYDMWLIMKDGSIKWKGEGKNVWGVELVSPITAHTTSPRLWGSGFQTVWQGIRNSFEILQSRSCGTHLHVSVPMGWSQGMMALKPVAKAAIYFEQCVDALMPSDRVINNDWCQSNRYNPVLRNQEEVGVIFIMIDNALSVSELASIMCSDGHGSASRSFRWNFKPLTDRKKVEERLATIEFRQPPGCTTAEELDSWALFGLSFITGSIYMQSRGAFIDPSKPASLAELHRLCKDGSFDEPSWSEPINRLFADKKRDSAREDCVRRTACEEKPSREPPRGTHDREENVEVKCARHLDAFAAYFDDDSDPAEDG